MDPGTGKVFIKKILSVYDLNIYYNLYQNPVLGVPCIINYEETDGYLTVIEEYVSGTGLNVLIDRKLLTCEMVQNIAEGLCMILKEMHSRIPAVIHRDIKPSNIIVDDAGAVSLIDFNAAKFYTGQKGRDTILIGTEGYAAPEQYGFGASDIRTDIYGFGMVLREMVQSLEETTMVWDGIITRATAIDAKERYPDDDALMSDLIMARHPMRKFLPPGFRTGKPLKMAAAIAGYAAILFLTTVLKVEGESPIRTGITRAYVCLVALSIVLISFNYLEVCRFMPLCASRKKYIRIIGTLLMNLFAVFVLSVLLVIGISITH